MNNLPKGNGYVRALRIVHIALVSGMLMFAAVIYFISLDISPAQMMEYGKDVLLGILCVATICLGISSYLWKKDISRMQLDALSLAEKLELYRKSAVRRYALSEAPGMLSIVCYFMTQEPRILIVTMLMILHLASLAPTSSKIAAHINESRDDVEVS